MDEMNQKFTLDQYHRDIPDSCLLADLKRVATVLEKSPTIEEYDNQGKYHPSTLIRRFGGWFEVLEKCNLEKTRSPLNISNEELFSNLEAVWIKLGRQPRYNELYKPLSNYSAATYANRFGSYRSALKSFVEHINKAGKQKPQIPPVDKPNMNKTTKTINLRMRFSIMRRDNFTCKQCGKSPAVNPGTELQIDHIFPYSKGGETRLENLQTLCSACNIGKSNVIE